MTLAASSLPEDSPLTWKAVLQSEREAQYFQDALSFVEERKKKGKTVYPPNKEVFQALTLAPFEKVKVVILGQDPYHGPQQAHGLCFSVRKGIAQPPSLQNIFKELQEDLGVQPPNHGCLEEWAKQGVLLLNAVLTVEAGKPGSHANVGWETFTDRVISELNDKRRNIVFLLWGSYAQKKGAFIDHTRHLVLKAPHPSPLSAHRGFFGCKHFSQTNAYLESHGIAPIDWVLTS